MTTLIIARHGNTFDPGDEPRRVGLNTDLPLSESGRVQARALGEWLRQSTLYPQAVYCSQLKRTEETAKIALQQAGYKEPVFPLAMFNEIDYGPDENQPEDAVIARLGADALHAWDERAELPPGWQFDPARCIEDWKNFAGHIVTDRQDCVMVVTSNGIARFAPHITGDFDSFAKNYPLKISTGAVCVFSHDNGKWHVIGWNVRPGIQ